MYGVLTWRAPYRVRKGDAAHSTLLYRRMPSICYSIGQTGRSTCWPLIVRGPTTFLLIR